MNAKFAHALACILQFEKGEVGGRRLIWFSLFMCLKCKCSLLCLEEQESYKVDSEDQRDAAAPWLPPLDGFNSARQKELKGDEAIISM